MVQREGRMIRQGNENKEVFVYRYITEGSFDSYSWQILETKQRFISQFLKGTSYQRSSEDLENNVLNYAEVKALALSEPIMKELAEKENKAKSLRLIIAKEEETRTNLSVEAEELEHKVCKLKKRYEVTIENANYLSHFTDEIYMQEYNKISEMFDEDIIFKKEVIGNEAEVLGFFVIVPDEQDEKKPHIFIERGNEKYKLNVSTSAKGNARRIINVLKGFGKRVDEEFKRYQDAVYRKQEIREMLEVSVESYKEELKYYEAEIVLLRDKLKIEG